MEKLYTIDDIAEMTGLTDRTIRNYIKDGKLTGRKIGVQWRFTEDDIRALFDDSSVRRKLSDDADGIVTGFIAEREWDSASACAAINLPPLTDEQRITLGTAAAKIVGEYEGGTPTRFSFQSRPEGEFTRLAARGDIDVIMKILKEAGAICESFMK